MSQMWIRCPNCDLMHSARPDQTCPRCGRAIPSSAYETSIATDAPAGDHPPRRSRLPMPASPALDRAVSSDVPPTTPEVSTPLTRYGTSASSLHRQLGVNPTPPAETKRPTATSWLVSLCAGLVASAAGGAAWGYAVIGIGKDIGFSAAIVGLATGLAIRGVGGRGLGTQIIAALCVILGFGIGKTLIIESPVAFTALIEKTAVDDRAMIIPAMVSLAGEGVIPQPVGHRLLPLPLDVGYAGFAEAMTAVARYESEALRHAQSSNADQRRALARGYLDAVMKGQPFIVRARVATAINDAILWLFLSMLVAFRLVRNAG